MSECECVCVCVCVCVCARARAYVRSRLYYVSFSAAFAVLLVRSIRRSSVQFSSRWYLCARKSPYALHPVSQKFPQLCL